MRNQTLARATSQAYRKLYWRTNVVQQAIAKIHETNIQKDDR